MSGEELGVMSDEELGDWSVECGVCGEEYYKIDKIGNLSVFDNFGHIATYKKVKNN